MLNQEPCRRCRAICEKYFSNKLKGSLHISDFILMSLVNELAIVKRSKPLVLSYISEWGRVPLIVMRHLSLSILENQIIVVTGHYMDTQHFQF